MLFARAVLKSKYDTKYVVNLVTRWLEQAVIGLNLCPFAKPVWRKGKIRIAVSSSETDESVLSDFADELLNLSVNSTIETTLLIVPFHLSRFEDFNQFLGLAEELLHECQLMGVFQIGSFHPDYQFADTLYDDRENWTNRSPFPVLHLLRETSISRAVDSYSKVSDIPDANIERLNKLDNSIFEEIFSKNKDGL